MIFNLFKKSKEEKNIPPKKDKTSPKIQPTRIGELGEYKVKIQLDQLPCCLHLNDLLIPNSKSKSKYSQIDHVVFSLYGIFVIETKNYAGTIYGDRNRGKWSVNGKFPILNPFHQNFGHIQAIKINLSVYDDSRYISIVSFTKRCTFKVNPELRKIQSQDLIVYDIELTEFITRKINVLKLQNFSPIFTEEELRDMYSKLKNLNIMDTAIRKDHVESLKSMGNSDSIANSNSLAKATCYICGKEVSEKVKDFCLSSKRFDGKVFCFDHQKRETVVK